MYERYLDLTKRAIIIVVILMILAIVLATLIATGNLIYLKVTDGKPILDKGDILDLLSYLLLIVIGLELLDTIYGYITESKIHVEIVLLIAITAVARELIVYNYSNSDGLFLMGIGVVIAGAATAYYLIRRVEKRRPEKATE